jgi:hypothetical protein
VATQWVYLTLGSTFLSNTTEVANGTAHASRRTSGELRQVGREVVEGERLLAEQEELLVALKRQNKDVRKVEAALEQTREDQRLREQDRQRLLSLLQS